MEIKDIKKVESELKAEIDEMGASPDRDARAAERCVPIIKQEIELVMLKSVQNLYFVIKEHVVTKGYKLKESDLRELVTIADYQYNLNVMKKHANILRDEVNNRFAGIKKDDASFMSRYVDSRRDFANFLQVISSFVDSAVYVTMHASKRTDSAYVRTLSKTLSAMRADLSKAKGYTSSWNRYGEGFTQIFDSVIEFFNSSTEVAQGFAVEYLNQQKEKKAAESEKTKNAVEVSRLKKPAQPTELSPRLKLIKKANDMYEEFCLDFMRDLEKQYAFSSKDLYEEFVNVRFKKFTEIFPMPIPNSASEGYAGEVINQINILIDHVSKISQNSYVTSVFPQKQ